MSKLSIKAGSTSKLLDVFIQDSSSTTGAGLTGLAFNTSGLTAYYYREGSSSSAAITLVTMVLGVWATSGFVVVDATNMPGVYQLAIPDVALAAGAKSLLVYLKGATNMAPLVLEIELTAVDNQSATAFMTSVATVTNLTNAPTVGDLTATMKASVTVAATSSTPSVTVTTNNDKTGYALSTAGVAAIWAQIITGTTTAIGGFRGMLAVLLGKASGMATTTAVFRDIGDTKPVVTATVDSNGNRTAITTDLT